MINRNEKLTIADKNEYTQGDEYYLHVYFGKDAEIDKLYKKHGGMVSVKVGKPEHPGTEQQNRLMHSLLIEYYKTGLHSAPEGSTFVDFKNFMKWTYGISFVMEVAGNKITILKSWADYTKQERCDFIDGLISEVKQSGAEVESYKIHEIMVQLEENAKLKFG